MIDSDQDEDENMESDDDENSDTESDGFHASLKNIQDLRQKYDNALDQLNTIDHNEKKKVLKAYADLEVDVESLKDEAENYGI